jgi:membrane carboxypeptidase/penicillin-binding protein
MLWIAVEDKNFYQHHGVDLFGIMRAVVNHLRQRKLAEGGST